MRQNKTSKKNRTNYVYRDAYGNAVIVRPGEDGVTDAIIALLHEADDAEFDADRRENYHVPVRYQAFQDGKGDDAEDRNDYLADTDSNPESLLIHSLESAQKRSDFNDVWTSLTDGQRELIKRKLQGRSNVDIAAEDGVTEAAIRNRLSKIQKKFETFLR